MSSTSDLPDRSLVSPARPGQVRFRDLPSETKYLILFFSLENTITEQCLAPGELQSLLEAFVHRDGSPRGVFWPTADDLQEFVSSRLNAISQLYPFDRYQDTFGPFALSRNSSILLGFWPHFPFYVGDWHWHNLLQRTDSFSISQRILWINFLSFVEFRIHKLLMFMKENIPGFQCNGAEEEIYRRSLRHFWVFLSPAWAQYQDYRRWMYMEQLPIGDLVNLDDFITRLSHGLASLLVSDASFNRWPILRMMRTFISRDLYRDPSTTHWRRTPVPTLWHLFECSALDTYVKHFLLSLRVDELFEFLYLDTFSPAPHPEQAMENYRGYYLEYPEKFLTVADVGLTQGRMHVQLQATPAAGAQARPNHNRLFVYEFGMREFHDRGVFDLRRISTFTRPTVYWDFISTFIIAGHH